ncbi:MAG: hypothetical protein ABEJ61_09810 [Haloferacaceae archaeon]
MDVWVRSEYAGELAVLSAWLTALLPWSVSYVPSVAGGSILDVRFPLLQVRYTFGLPLARAMTVRDPVSGFLVTGNTPAQVAYAAWVAGAAVAAVAVLLSVVYYARQARVEAAPVDPVRTMGVLLLLVGGTLGAATALFVVRFPGFTVPVGALFALLFGGVLLVVERADVADGSPAEADPSGD